MNSCFKIVLLSVLILFFSFHATSQEFDVVGVVLDQETNSPLAYTTIKVTRLKEVKGQVCDKDGKFRIKVSKAVKVEFSRAGFATYEMIFSEAPKEKITIYLRNNASLEDVVVQGFNKRSKNTLTGSSVKIDGKEVQDIPVSNVLELLQGKVAGLNIQNNNGTPGEMGTINLRGISSINITEDGFLTPTSPLFIVDGVYYDLNSNFEYELQSGVKGINPLSLIPQDDIESIEVLKDAAASSIYGSRAAYGVIIINTKRGRSREPVIRYVPNFGRGRTQKGQKRTVFGGVNERLQRINFILANDKSLSQAIVRINDFSMLSDSLNPYYNNSIDWQRYYSVTGPTFGHNLDISGGDERFNYSTNFNYSEQRGIILNTGFKRYALSLKFGYSPTRQIALTSSIAASMGVQNLGSGNSLLQKGVAASSNASSLLPPPSIFSANSTALQALKVDNTNTTNQVISSLQIRYIPYTGISISNDFSVSFNTATQLYFQPGLINLDKSSSDQSNSFSNNFNERFSISLTKTINSHYFNLLSFGEVSFQDNNSNKIVLVQTPSDQLRGPIGYNLELSGDASSIGYGQNRTAGVGASFNYNYKQIYVFDLTLRRDGTSANGRDKPFSLLPSYSARWNFSKEKFMQRISWLQSGGIRGSWGKSIAPNSNRFTLSGKYNETSTFNGFQGIEIDPRLVPGFTVEPTSTTSLNIGLDAALFNNKVNLSIEHYFRQVDNQAINISLPSYSGFSTRINTETSLVNYGTEFSIRYSIINNQKNDFHWTANFVGEIREDILTKLPFGLREYKTGFAGSGASVISRVGLNAISNGLYYTSGVYTNTSDVPVNIVTGERKQLDRGSGHYFQAGDPNWVDVNGDYVIDEFDLKPIGNPIPKITGGVGTNLRYKFFTLSVQMVYTLLRDVLNFSMANRLNIYNNVSSTAAYYPIDDFDYWKPGSDKSTGLKEAKFPNPFDFTRTYINPYRGNQTLFLEDGSYWKIKSIVLSAVLPKKFMQKFYFPWGIRVVFSVNNVAIFTNYSGADPENVSSLGRDESNGFPLARTFATTFNIQF